MSYKYRVTLFVMMLIAFLLMTFNSIHVHAAEVAADGGTQLQAAPPAPVKHTLADINGVVVFVEGQAAKYILFVFKDGTVALTTGDDCFDNEDCRDEVTLLVKQRRAIFLKGDVPEQPDIKS